MVGTVTVLSLTQLGVSLEGRAASRGTGVLGPSTVPSGRREAASQSARAPRSLPGPAAGAPGGRGLEPVKAERASGLALPAMAPPSLPRALGLGLLALCLLALLCGTRARPGERLIGGRTNLSPSDPQVQKAAQAAVASYNMGSTSLYYFRDTHILKAQSQVRRAAGRGERQLGPGQGGMGGQVNGMSQGDSGRFNAIYFFN